MKVDVYFNLRKKVFSIRHKGKVIKHLDKVCLKDCEFVVSEKGRQRVLREKRKNVHAVVRGTLIKRVPDVLKKEITYNPYVMKTFCLKSSGKSIYHAKHVKLVSNGEKGRVYVK